MITKDEYKPIVKETNQFKTIEIEFLYPYKLNKTGSHFLIPSFLVNYSAKYKEEEIFNKKVMEYSILNLSSGGRRIGTEYFYSFNLSIPDESVMGEDVLEKALSFFIDAIYEPNASNGMFAKHIFEREKEATLEYIENANQNIDRYCINKVFELVDTTGHLKNNIFMNKEKIKKVTNKQVYSFYEKTIQNCTPYVFVIGNIKEEKVKKLLDTYLYSKNKKQTLLGKNYYCFLPKVSKETVRYKETKNFYQSYLTLVYKVRDAKEQDRDYLDLVSSLLSSQSSDLLIKKLRDDSGLVYSSFSELYSRSGMLMISAKIHKSAKEEAEEKIKEILEDLKNKELIEPLLTNIKDRKRINLKRSLDDKFFLKGELKNAFFGCEEPYEDAYHKILEITSSDIASFIDRLELDVVYYLEGDLNETKHNS